MQNQNLNIFQEKGDLKEHRKPKKNIETEIRRIISGITAAVCAAVMCATQVGAAKTPQDRGDGEGGKDPSHIVVAVKDSSGNAKGKEKEVLSVYGGKIQDFFKIGDTKYFYIKKSRNKKGITRKEKRDIEKIEGVEGVDEVNAVKAVNPQQANALVPISDMPMLSNDIYRSQQRELTMYNAEGCWRIAEGAKADRGADKRKIRVGVVDTGVKKVSDMGKNVLYNEEYNVIHERKEIADKACHGTVVASVIGATSNNREGIAGLASGTNNDLVEILPVAVSDNALGESNEYYLAKGIVYAVNHGCKVINVSMGIEGNSGYMEDVDRYVESQGVSFSAAAGNERETEKISTPGGLPCVIGVMATDEKDPNKTTDYSNLNKAYGYSAYGYAFFPGSWSQETCSSQLLGVRGTSFSSPYAAATVALMRVSNPALSTEEIRSILKSTGARMKTAEKKAPGCVNINPYKAIEEAASMKGGVAVLQAAAVPVSKKVKKPKIKKIKIKTHSKKISITYKISGTNDRVQNSGIVVTVKNKKGAKLISKTFSGTSGKRSIKLPAKEVKKIKKIQKHNKKTKFKKERTKKHLEYKIVIKPYTKVKYAKATYGKSQLRKVKYV